VLLSNSADIVAGAITVMAALSDRARHLDIRGIAALNCDAFYLNTNRPDIKTLRDFGSSDRIAVSAVKLSIHAIVLQMAAEKEFGPGRHTELDALTVSMPHPEAMASLLALGTEVTAHITTTPFKKMELANPRVHRVLSSNTLVGGRATGAMVWTTGKFRTENPKAYTAFFNALKNSIDSIRNDPHHAAQVYSEMENSKLDPVLIRAIVADPEDIFTMVPEHTFDFVDFMQRDRPAQRPVQRMERLVLSRDPQPTRKLMRNRRALSVRQSGGAPQCETTIAVITAIDWLLAGHVPSAILISERPRLAPSRFASLTLPNRGPRRIA
jgi:NitT/TauT family transport system substrate-binding protein